MKINNTPARRKRLTPHMRLRLEKAKELKAQGKELKGKPSPKPNGATGETDPEKMTMTVPRTPIYKKNTLAEPEKPAAKFKKRQIHKSWLPTHVWHAKRAQMTAPKGPLWRFAVPLTPADKCYRSIHRASSSTGCVAWDTSYMSTIMIEGVEASITGLLRAISVEEAALTGQKYIRWREGTRSWSGWLRERDRDQRWISHATLCWRPVQRSIDPGEDAAGISSHVEVGQSSEKRTAEANTNTDNEGQEEPTQVASEEPQPSANVKRQKKTARKRQLILRVHPAAFLQLWKEILKVAKIQRPPPSVEDLRFQLGSIELVGSSAFEALAGVLHPRPSPTVSSSNASDFESTFKTLALVNRISSTPTNAIIPLAVQDPRLFHPPRAIDTTANAARAEEIAKLLSTWPFDNPSPEVPSIFEFKDRHKATQLPFQKTINRRKGKSAPGLHCEPVASDPAIPILLLATGPVPGLRQSDTITLILPWKCVQPLWHSLMHYPLSTGGNPRFGGLDQKRQVQFENGEPWFPGDFPGTKAGWEWELRERSRRKEDWQRKPKGRRVEWENIDMGLGRKGEIGIGWGCDWTRLFNLEMDEDDKRQSENKSDGEGTSDLNEDAAKPAPSADECVPPKHIQHLPLSTPIPIFKIHPHALTPIHLTLLHRGRPEPCARIYRLPSNKPSLLQQWLILASLCSSAPPPKRFQDPSLTNHEGLNASQQSLLQTSKKDLPLHQRMKLMAQSLLRDPPPLDLPPSQQTTTDASTQEAMSRVMGSGSYDDEEPAHLPCPDEVDLIGFVTTANYDLGKGKAAAIGNVAVAKVLSSYSSTSSTSPSTLRAVDEAAAAAAAQEGDAERRGMEDEVHGIAAVDELRRLQKDGGLCIIRNAGHSVARLAKWRFCG